MFERWTERARQIVVLAQEEARETECEYIGTEHLLGGLLREEEGIGGKVLAHFGLTLDAVRERIERGQAPSKSGQIPFTPRCKKVCELSLREALSLGNNYIGTEHVLLGLIREHEGAAADILNALKIDTEEVRNEVLRQMGSAYGRRHLVEMTPASQARLDVGKAVMAALEKGVDPVTILDLVHDELNAHQREMYADAARRAAERMTGS